MAAFPIIPGYKIERELGQGGMARVYLAHEEKLERHVALKVLLPSLAEMPHAAERFLKEARTAGKLRHNGIITIYDVDKHNDTYYMAVEYLEGGSLKDMINAGAMDPSQALTILSKVAAALDYAHVKGFIHRDIKPDNILFREDGEPVLTDFGIAKAVDSATKLTKTGMSIGTPHYMSPEQIRGLHLDGRADIYSLGAVFFEMLTGKCPYDGTDTITIAIKHIQDPVPKFDAGLSGYQSLLGKMLAKDPNDRFGRCLEIAEFVAGMNESSKESNSRGSEPDAATIPDQEAMLFEFAEKMGTPEAFAHYLNMFPDGKFSARARRELGSKSSLEKKVAAGYPAGKISKPAPKTRLVQEADKLVNQRIFKKGALSFNFKNRGQTPVTLSGALARQGEEGLLVWEDDGWVPAKFPKAKRNSKGFWEVNFAGLEMVYIPAGEFVMGMEGSERMPNEGPVHKVWLDGYWIGKSPVTGRQFIEFCHKTGLYSHGMIFKSDLPPGYTKESEDLPATQVAYFDAMNYCQWLSAKIKMEVGLPTEAEWEKAARGTDGRLFPWGKQELSCQHANFDECGSRLGEAGSWSLGESPYGVIDMCGNVWEWCLDFYDKNFYSNSQSENPLLDMPSVMGSEGVNVVRGGAFNSPEFDVSCTRRVGESPIKQMENVGFRVAMSVERVDVE